MEDPKGAVEQELETRLPEELRVVAVEETTDTVYLVLPVASPAGEVGELSELDLEAVAGGASAMCPSITDDPGECPQPLEP
jgi:hypothetical protein